MALPSLSGLVAQNAAQLQVDRTAGTAGTSGTSGTPGITLKAGFTTSNFSDYGTAGNHHAGPTFNTANSKALGNLDSQISTLQAYGANGGALTADQQSQLSALQAQRNQVNTVAWQSVQNDGSSGATLLQNAINSGQLTWAEVGANIDIGQVSNDVALQSEVQALISKYHPTTSGASPSTSAQSQTASDYSSVVSSITGDLTSQAVLAGVMASGSSSSLTQADAAQQANLSGVASVGTALASSSGGANAAREASATAASTTQQYGTQRAILQTQNQNAVESYINQVFSNDLTNNTALANASTQDKISLQGQAADALATAIQNSIGTADNASQLQLNQLNQAIAAWKTAEQGSEQQASLWGSIVSIGGGLLEAGAGAAAAYLSGGTLAPVGAALIAGGTSQVINGAKSA